MKIYARDFGSIEKKVGFRKVIRRGSDTGESVDNGTEWSDFDFSEDNIEFEWSPGCGNAQDVEDVAALFIGNEYSPRAKLQ